ncbi:MAG: YXWGXW repeat-containing protein, partial [Bacteroidetes bacterium]|nr:YXWGXW repeat-containing protein [Bacteroidota bacterium]
WASGKWVTPPRHGGRWVAGHWKKHSGGWVWKAGRWRY